jgi:hypothetical protein
MLKFRVSSKSCVAALDPDTERLDQQETPDEDSQPLQSYVWVFFEPAVAHIILDSAFLFKLDPDWIQIKFGWYVVDLNKNLNFWKISLEGCRLLLKLGRPSTRP